MWTPVRRLKAWTPYYDKLSESDLNHVAKVVVVVVVDLGVGNSGDRTRTALQKLIAHSREDAIIHLGDIAYNLDGIDPSLSRTYFQAMVPLPASLPIWSF